MKVHELMYILERCNPNAFVKIRGDGYQPDWDPYAMGDEEDIDYIDPVGADERHKAKVIVIER